MAEAELAQTRARVDRLAQEIRRQDEMRAALAAQDEPEIALAAARQAVAQAGAELTQLRDDLTRRQAEKETLTATRDEAGATLAAAKGELAGIEREYNALQRDREARAKQAAGKHGLPAALDRVRAAPGYERALAAVLGRDAKAPLGQPGDEVEGRFWTGGGAPAPVADSLAAHVPDCPAELAARLALVHVVDVDDRRMLAPGEWLVTRDGRLRRWDGFIARGEGAAEAARLEAENRFAELAAQLPTLRAAVEEAETHQQTAQEQLAELQRALIAAERAIAQAAEAERNALRLQDQAEAARERRAARMAELEAAASDLQDQRQQAESEATAAEAKKAALPDPEHGRATLATAQAKHEAARAALQAATAELAAHDQALAVARERTAARAADIRGWQARSDEATRRLSEMARRFEEIEEEHRIIAAKPPALMRDIEQGDAIRERLGKELTEAETALGEAEAAARAIDAALAEANETLATAREDRAGASARAENEEARRSEFNRLSGERFQCPRPCSLPALHSTSRVSAQQRPNPPRTNG